MIRAAGILFLCGGSALFLRRGPVGDHAGEWALPGGKLEDGETQEQAAIRETVEETGFDVLPVALRPWTRTVTPAVEMPAPLPMPDLPMDGDVPVIEEAVEIIASEAVDFATFIVRLKEQFTPVLCDENDGYCWAPVNGAPQPIHPGVQIVLDRLNMDELGVARAMAAGQLASPQQYENLWLFAIRITGTGVSYRHNRKEFVWRDPEIYLNEEFLARCNGLAVLWEHPENALLNHKEFHDRKIGSVFVPYISLDRPDEVWAIVKIYDDDAAKEMQEDVLSTSPSVNFADPTVNDRIELEDGRIMLIEGKPSLIDHICICPMGVWDKGGDPTGVESVTVLADAENVVITRRELTSFDLLRTHVAAFALKASVRAYK